VRREISKLQSRKKSNLEWLDKLGAGQKVTNTK